MNFKKILKRKQLIDVISKQDEMKDNIFLF